MTAPTEGARKPPAQPASVKIAAAKGRPMLSWVGKRPLREVRAFPAQLIERFSADGSVNEDVDWFDWPDRYERGGLLFHGDNKEVLAHLLTQGFRGKVDLVYIDPPFDSGADYVRRVQLRGASGTARLDGATYTLGEQIQYTDIWANDTYLQFMYERLLLLKELLSPTGSLYLHADARRVSQLRLVMDEIFGEGAFRNQIAWRRTSSHGGANRFGAVTDYLLFFAAAGATWNAQFQEMTQVHLERHYRHKDDRGTYALGELTAPGTRRGPTGEPWRGFGVTAIGRHWANLPSRLEQLNAEGLIYWPEKAGGWPRLKRYLADNQGRPGTDFWDDIDLINMVGLEREDYPTQKPEGLLDRVISASSNLGDVVLDCFIGSGTTAAVAQKLGRRWIGADINKGAIQTTVKRLAGVMEEEAAGSVSAQQKAFEETDDDAAPPPPAQLAFTTWRVNDYDLAIQHNEAVNLACEHLGVERTKTDPFFDGSLGKKLVKIVAFNHPATVLDLQDAARELESRPDEPRDAVLVALGTEMSTEPWLAEYNRHRPINKLEIIELRSDPKYGKFFEHRPASARVRLEILGEAPLPAGVAGRLDGELKARVIIDDFISPSILERLGQQEGVLAPQVTDWRSMVDSVMIDTAHDGSVFDVAVADIPERRTDLVSGTYEIELPWHQVYSPVAVKITDMLGEEVLVTLDPAGASE